MVLIDLFQHLLLDILVEVVAHLGLGEEHLDGLLVLDDLYSGVGVDVELEGLENYLVPILDDSFGLGLNLLGQRVHFEPGLAVELQVLDLPLNTLFELVGIDVVHLVHYLEDHDHRVGPVDPELLLALVALGWEL